MGRFVKGEIVVVKFPFTDLSGAKPRPALVLAEVEYGDLVLCQITSKTYGDRIAVAIRSGDFASGSLPLQSFARPGRLLTAAPNLVSRSVGRLTESKRLEVVASVTVLIT